MRSTTHVSGFLLISLLSSMARAQPAEPGATPAVEPSPSSEITPAATTAAPAISEPSPAIRPLAGYHDGLFYLRDKDDLFRLYVSGRVHVDFLSYFGPGLGNLLPDAALKSGFLLRRARLDLSGEFFTHWQWQVAGDFGPVTTDNTGARTATRDCTIDATSGAQTCSDRTNNVEAAGVRPIPTDVYINFKASPELNVQVGQFLVPFTFENRVSDNSTPFLERSLPVRGIGIPTSRDIGAMVWGELPNKVLYYSAGIYNGDGPNRPNQDNRFDVVGRVVLRPFAAGKSAAKGFQVGLSGRRGTREQRLVGYDLPSLTTQGGYAFWKPTYRDSANRVTHILPSGTQAAAGFDVYLPIDRFDIAGELIYASSNTREAVDGQQLSPFTQRLGSFHGHGFYAEAGVWIVGDRSIAAFPGAGKPAHVDLEKETPKPAHGLQVFAKVEQLQLRYHGSSREGADDARTPSGDIEVESLSLGVNYRATKHLRLSAN
jgi:phosphate-selective porin